LYITFLKIKNEFLEIKIKIKTKKIIYFDLFFNNENNRKKGRKKI